MVELDDKNLHPIRNYKKWEKTIIKQQQQFSSNSIGTLRIVFFTQHNNSISPIVVKGNDVVMYISGKHLLDYFVEEKDKEDVSKILCRIDEINGKEEKGRKE